MFKVITAENTLEFADYQEAKRTAIYLSTNTEGSVSIEDENGHSEWVQFTPQQSQ